LGNINEKELYCRASNQRKSPKCPERIFNLYEQRLGSYFKNYIIDSCFYA
jgi:hypothetical protein